MSPSLHASRHDHAKGGGSWRNKLDRHELSERLYRLLLLTLPADLSSDFGDDMAQLFRDNRRESAGARFA